MNLMNLELSEDTRQTTIIYNSQSYDLHKVNNLYYICIHGTYEIIKTLTEKEYNAISI